MATLRCLQYSLSLTTGMDMYFRQVLANLLKRILQGEIHLTRPTFWRRGSRGRVGADQGSDFRGGNGGAERQAPGKYGAGGRFCA